MLEHLSSKDGVDFVSSAAPQVGGTITPYHLVLTRTDWLGWGLKPYFYCMPVIKTAKDRDALRKAATSGAACYFLGTDSAPHPVAKKLAVNGIPGLFNAPVAIETYAKVFEQEGALDKLEAFASLNGPKHYRLPANEATDHAGEVRVDRAGRDHGRGAGREGAGLSRRGDDRVEGGGIMTAGIGFLDRKVMAELTAKMLLEVEAVRFMTDKPFIFTSGWASPVYTDCRRLISFPRVRATLIDFAAATLMRDAGFEQFDAIAGGETAGIPFAAWMADRFGLPMLYVRKKPKGFGRNAQIEGNVVEGQRVLLVEDMTTDGRSKVNFCNALREAGTRVEHCLVFFFYDIFPEGRKILGDLGVTLHSLATWWDVLAVAKASGKFDATSSPRSRSSCMIRPAGRRRTAGRRWRRNSGRVVRNGEVGSRCHRRRRRQRRVSARRWRRRSKAPRC